MLNLGKLVREAIYRYFNNSKALPDCVILYRDGVGEGQIKTIVEQEVKAIKAGMAQMVKDAGATTHSIKFAEIVVTKRINDRFFKPAESSSSGGGRGGRGGGRGGRGGGRGGGQHGGGGDKHLQNPSSGTVVFQECIKDDKGYDFFLVSQNVTQGTCTPTHYHVIYDDTGLTQDVIWQLTYNQCFNYFNWNGSVKVPAPLQYADKLAYLIGHYVHATPHESLDDLLYFL